MALPLKDIDRTKGAGASGEFDRSSSGVELPEELREDVGGLAKPIGCGWGTSRLAIVFGLGLRDGVL